LEHHSGGGRQPFLFRGSRSVFRNRGLSLDVRTAPIFVAGIDSSAWQSRLQPRWQRGLVGSAAWVWQQRLQLQWPFLSRGSRAVLGNRGFTLIGRIATFLSHGSRAVLGNRGYSLDGRVASVL